MYIQKVSENNSKYEYNIGNKHISGGFTAEIVGSKQYLDIHNIFTFQADPSVRQYFTKSNGIVRFNIIDDAFTTAQGEDNEALTTYAVKTKMALSDIKSIIELRIEYLERMMSNISDIGKWKIYTSIYNSALMILPISTGKSYISVKYTVNDNSIIVKLGVKFDIEYNDLGENSSIVVIDFPLLQQKTYTSQDVLKMSNKYIVDFIQKYLIKYTYETYLEQIDKASADLSNIHRAEVIK